MTVTMKHTIAHKAPPSISAFETWLDTRGVKRHPSLSIIPMSDSTGFTVQSISSIPRAEKLCVILKPTIFSHQTSSLKMTVEIESSSDIIYRLATCLLHELRLGEESNWYGWLQVLPRETIDLPVLYLHLDLERDNYDGEGALEWLMYTEAGREIDRQRDEDGISLVRPNLRLADPKEGLLGYHETLDLPPTTTHPSQPTFCDFAYAFSLVSTRGFMLDAYHQIGIVPFADMFNHSFSDMFIHPDTSAHTSLLCDPAVCPECGSLQICSHDEEEPERLFQIRPEYLSDLKRDGEDNQVDMRAERDIAANVEVFSCYERELISAKGLVGYGFIQSEPTENRVTWGTFELLTQEIAKMVITIIKRGKVWRALSGEVYPYNMLDSPNPLFRSGGDDEPGSMTFALDGNGILSFDFILPIFLLTKYEGFSGSVEELEDTLIMDIKRLQTIADTGEGRLGDEDSELAGVVDQAIGFLHSRIRRQKEDKLSLEELEEKILALSAEDILKRQAMTFVLQERQLLERTIDRWESLLEAEDEA